jgi:hypothetical protein
MRGRRSDAPNVAGNAAMQRPTRERDAVRRNTESASPSRCHSSYIHKEELIQPRFSIQESLNSAEDNSVRKQIFDSSLSEHLTESDCELLRSLQIQPPARAQASFRSNIAGIDLAECLSTPLTWISVAVLSTGAMVFLFWMSYLLQRADF